MQTAAAVTRSRGEPFAIEAVDVEAPGPDEVLVRIVGTGICHTDLIARDGGYPVPVPVVLGHEGAGVVEAVGSAVDELAVGDHVVLTYRSCGTCPSCLRARPGYCARIFELTYGGARPDGTTPLSRGGEPLHANFFGQSSFAEHAIAHRQNAVKVRDDVPLELLGPLGCGVQTGFGSVSYSLGAAPGDTIAVLGTGPVGLSAVMAAAIAGCTTIIAVDLKESRLRLAGELGATDALRPEPGVPLADQLREIVPDGLRFALDTTGQPDVVRGAVDALAPMGVFGLVGGSPLGTEVSLDMNTMLFGGRTFRGIIGGDAIPKLAIPLLVDLFAAGRLPLDKLTTFYPLASINEAVADTESGAAVKAVLRPAA